MNQSVFDPDAFMQTTITESNDTKLNPVPENEYPAMIAVDDKHKPTIRTTDKGNVILDINWEIDDVAAKEATGLDTPRVRQSLFLDINDHGMLDMGRGRNVQLGKLREAVGLNIAGQAFSMSQLAGRTAKVLVKHRVTDTGDIFADVKAVSKL
jgi:hypothetical protein